MSNIHFRTLKLSIILLIFLGVFLTLLPFSFAQEAPTGLNVTISPTVIELTANPGETLSQKFRIRNNNATPLTLGITVDKLAPQNGQVVPVDPAKGDDSVSWISFGNQTMTAQPKEWTDVSFSISVPKTAAFGYYFALRIGQMQATPSASTPNTKLLGQVIIPVLLTVRSSGAKAELHVVDFKPLVSFNEYLPVTFSITVKNTGNVYLKPRGNVFIQTSSQKDVAALDVNVANGVVLPGGTRTFETSWDDGFFVQQPIVEDGTVKKDASGKPVTTLTINWDKLTHFRIGKYNADSLIVYDNGKRDVPIETSTTFWVFPYTIIGSLVIAIVIIFLVGRFFIKLYIKREINKYKNS